MQHKTRAKWVSYKERDLFGCDFSGFGSDRSSLAAEIQVSEAIIRQQAENSLLLAVYMHEAAPTPELIRFFERSCCPVKNPIRKMAILGVSNIQRIWYQRVKGISWPKNARFFDDYEKAKAWLVAERF